MTVIDPGKVPPSRIALAALVLFRLRGFIVTTVGVCSLVAVAVSLVVPPSYRSTATLLPGIASTNDLLSGLPGQLGQIRSLLAQRTEGGLGRLIPTIAQSEAVLSRVIYHRYETKQYPDSVDLIGYWKIKEKTPRRDYEVAELTLRGSVYVVTDPPTGVIEISVDAPEPRLSADILRTLLASMDDFLRTRHRTAATNEREWVERRVSEVKRDLATSEARLEDFTTRNRVIQSSPALTTQAGRLEREVQLNSTVYVELRRQLELAKVAEIQNSPVLNVLDSAQVPQVRSSPRRTRIVLITLAFSLAASVSLVFLWAGYGEAIRRTAAEILMALSMRARFRRETTNNP